MFRLSIAKPIPYFVVSEKFIHVLNAFCDFTFSYPFKTLHYLAPSVNYNLGLKIFFPKKTLSQHCESRYSIGSFERVFYISLRERNKFICGAGAYHTQPGNVDKVEGYYRLCYIPRRGYLRRLLPAIEYQHSLTDLQIRFIE
jgi:hypothetical protein